MKKDIVETIGTQDFADSQMVAQKFRVKHNKVVRTIENLMERFDEIRGTDGTPDNQLKVIKEKRNYQGQSFTAYKMNRIFFSLLAMRFENKTALEWQVKFNERFYENERLRIISETNRKNDLWFSERESKKQQRLVLTDTVNAFVNYSRGYGSRNAEFYFKAISDMAYSALGVKTKVKNIRDTLSVGQLNRLSEIEDLQAELLCEYMASRIPYKKIYKKLKKEICTFVMEVDNDRH